MLPSISSNQNVKNIVEFQCFGEYSIDDWEVIKQSRKGLIIDSLFHFKVKFAQFNFIESLTSIKKLPSQFFNIPGHLMETIHFWKWVLELVVFTREVPIYIFFFLGSEPHTCDCTCHGDLFVCGSGLKIPDPSYLVIRLHVTLQWWINMYVCLYVSL